MKKISVIILAVFLSSCASFTQTPTALPKPKIVNHYLPWEQRKAQLNAIQNFRVNGNLAIHEATGHGVNASFSWEQNYPNYQLNFFGPLGTQSAVLTSNPKQVSLTTHQQTYHAQNPEKLLRDQLGLNLPVSQFYYWLRGLPAPQSRYTINLDAYNHIMQLRQSGWRVVYQHFTNIGKIDMPDRIQLSNCQWQVRIRLTHWDIK
ncbi:MAG TPA: lipoprotein insertase outer membrane protein LolB [Candidatus Aquirickettsiella sp.]|jgi:outer membrane lipoprotein LolB